MEPKNNSLPIITIAQPCPVQWEQMQGSESKRFCDHCTKHVYNFAEMPVDEVGQMLRSGGKICAQVRRKPDGSIVTIEDRRKFLGRRNWLQRVAVLAASVVTVFTFGGCNSETIIRYIPWIDHEQTQSVGGKIAPLGGVIEIGPEELGDISIQPEPITEPPAQPISVN